MVNEFFFIIYVLCNVFYIQHFPFIQDKLTVPNSAAQTNEHPLNWNLHTIQSGAIFMFFIKERERDIHVFYKRESRKEWLYSHRQWNQCPDGSKKCLHCTLITSADVQVMKRSWQSLSEFTKDLRMEMSARDKTRSMGRVRSPQGGGASGYSTSWRNCAFQLSLFSVCFSFPIFTTKAHLPATNQSRTQSQASAGQQHPTVSSLQLGRFEKVRGSGWKACGADHATIWRVCFISDPVLRVLQSAKHW